MRGEHLGESVWPAAGVSEAQQAGDLLAGKAGEGANSMLEQPS